MKRALDAFVCALAYFTVLPIGARDAPDAWALAMLPLVGALTGTLAGTAAYAVSLVAPHALAVATAFGLSIVLTGAIHVDGFLDSCDALFASVTPERRLEILKDPRHGTFALAGFAVLAAFWLAALWSLPAARLPAVLAFSGALARWASALNAYIVRDARADEQKRAFASKPPMFPIASQGVLLFFAAATSGTPAIVAFAVAPLLSLLGGQWAKNRLNGGIAGDVYGFLIVIVEIAVFLVFIAV